MDASGVVRNRVLYLPSQKAIGFQMGTDRWGKKNKKEM
jgi:hypothetical protein